MKCGLRQLVTISAIGIITGYLLTSCTDVKWSDAKVKQSKAEGERVVAALNQYFHDHGAYPKKLDALVPSYLHAIKPPAAGNEQWNYYSTGDDHFIMCFEDDSASKPTYWIEKEGVWRVDEKGL